MNRRILPLYVVVFVGFLGYSLMIATFTPMILRNDNGMLPGTSTFTERSLVLGLLLSSIRSDSSWARPSSAHFRTDSDGGPSSSSLSRRRRSCTALALAICLPSCAAMLSLAASDQEQGRVMGNNQSMQVGAESLSGLVGGALAAILISPSPFSSSRGWRSREA
jgi:hypothetical protein